MGFFSAAAGIAGSILGSKSQSKASDKAAKYQYKSAQAGINEQRRQFDEVQKLLAPYIQAGIGSITGQQELLGLQGDEAQQAAIQQLEQSPQFAALIGQGEEAILQNAAATGGLRGGNTQAALAQFRPQMLSSLIEQQYGRLGGLTGIGQASATGQAAAAQSLGQNVSGLLQQQGAARAGGALAQGQAQANMWGNIAGGVGNIAGSLFGGGGLF